MENYCSILEVDDEDDDNVCEASPPTKDVACVGAGIGGGFTHTSELKTLNYPEAMTSEEKTEWEEEIKLEDDRMNKYNVWEPTPMYKEPENTKPLTSTWVFKKKSNGKRRGRLNAHGFKQIEGVNFDKDDIAAPVTNEVTMRVLMVIILVLQLYSGLIDVKGAFLQGEFGKGEKELYIEAPQGLEKHYPKNVYLKLLAPICGLRNAAMAFWRKLVTVMKKLNCDRSRADPCLHYKWTTDIIILWLSWIDDCIYAGKEDQVNKMKQEFMVELDSEDSGALNECVGVKVERKDDELKLTQPVLVQSLEDEFGVPKNVPKHLPAPPGKELLSDGERLIPAEEKIYRSGVGKLLFIMRYSRPDVLNVVRELSKWMTCGSTVDHMKILHQTINYIVHTKIGD